MILDLSQNHLDDSLKGDKERLKRLSHKRLNWISGLMFVNRRWFLRERRKNEEKNLFNLKFMEQARKAAIFFTVNDFIYPFGRMTTFLSRQWLNRIEPREEKTLGGRWGVLISLSTININLNIRFILLGSILHLMWLVFIQRREGKWSKLWH